MFVFVMFFFKFGNLMGKKWVSVLNWNSLNTSEIDQFFMLTSQLFMENL